MPLNQLALITITICFQFLLSWAFAMFYKRLAGYRLENYDKINFFINCNGVLSLVAVSIAVLGYYFKIIQ